MAVELAMGAPTAGDSAEKTLLDMEATMLDAGTLEAGALEPRSAVAPVSSDARLRHGSVVGNLQVLSPLGEGAMGATYVARHPILRTAFAVKTFKTSRDDVFKEAYLASRIDSAHVVPITDAGHLTAESGERVPYLVQHYVDGLDLRDVIAAVRGWGRTVPAGFAARIVAEVALGLHGCHKAGVVHCDVKPSNIMLHGSGTAMLGDFGIAQSPQHAPEEGFRVTGSPAYIPPELWSEGGVTSRRSDIYALGVTAHQLMTGGLPLMATNLNEWRRAHLNDTYLPPPPRSPREAYIYQVIARTLDKAPENRPETAEMVAALLEPMIDGLPKFVGRSGETVSVGPLRIDAVVGNLQRANADVVAWSVSPVAEPEPVSLDQTMRDMAVLVGPDEVAPPSRLGDVSWPLNPSPGERQTALVAASMDGSVCIQRVMMRLLFGAEARRCARVALPPLGTRVGQVPMELAAKMMLETVRTFAALRPHHVRHIQVMLDSSTDLDAWRSTMDYFGGRSHHGHLQRWEG